MFYLSKKIKMTSWIQIVIFWNGLYDLINSALILINYRSCHSYLFIDNKCPLVFGYWIFTYGIVRTWGGIFFNEHIQFQYLCVFSYLIEGCCLIHMMYNNENMLPGRVISVVFACFTFIIVFCFLHI